MNTSLNTLCIIMQPSSTYQRTWPGNTLPPNVPGGNECILDMFTVTCSRLVLIIYARDNLHASERRHGLCGQERSWRHATVAQRDVLHRVAVVKPHIHSRAHDGDVILASLGLLIAQEIVAL